MVLVNRLSYVLWGNVPVLRLSLSPLCPILRLSLSCVCPYPTFVCPTFVPVHRLSNPTSVRPTFVRPTFVPSYVCLSYVCPSTQEAYRLKARKTSSLCIRPTYYLILNLPRQVGPRGWLEIRSFWKTYKNGPSDKLLT